MRPLSVRVSDGLSSSGGAFRPWLLAIVRNTYLTWIRKNQQQALEPLEDDAESAGANPEELLLERVDSDRLRRALDRGGRV